MSTFEEQRRMELATQLFERVGIEAKRGSISSMGGAGGFSGAQFWRCSTEAGNWCLRRWAPGTEPDRVMWIQSVIREVAKHVGTLAVAVADREGATTFVRDGDVYEVTSWLPGVADYWESPGDLPNDTKLANAMRALAEWHLAAEAVGDPFANNGKELVAAPSKGLAMRNRRCDALLSGKLAELESASANDDREYVRAASGPLITGFRSVAHALQSKLKSMTTVSWQHQLCLRDVWHDHVLFTADAVTGIVDYDAMRFETPVGDVARLLGSLVGNDRERFRLGLAAYPDVRPMTAAEVELLSLWDASNAAMAGLQWLEWLCVERRVFPDETAVKRLLMRHVDRAASLC